MQTIKMTWTGTCPLMVHAADVMVNPLHPLTRKIKEFTGKRKKTDADHEMIARLEWEAGLYYSEALGPIMPAKCIDVTIRNAARMQKRGKDVEKAVMVVQDEVPIEYEGPRTPEKMWADGRFMDMRPVRVQANRLMRCRPIFPAWSITFDIAYDPDVVNKEDVIAFQETAGQYIGLCEMRPRFGKFSAGLANGVS